jgi:hypothetical protein
MRVTGGLAVGLGSLLGVSALVCYATTDALGSDEMGARDTLESISLGLGLAGLVHVAAGIPLLVIGKRQKRRHDAWAQGRTAWRPRIAGGPHGLQLGVTLQF